MTLSGQGAPVTSRLDCSGGARMALDEIRRSILRLWGLVTRLGTRRSGLAFCC